MKTAGFDIGGLLVLVAAAILQGCSPSSAPAAAVASPSHGTFAGQFNIGGGRELYLQCQGMGAPTVILESGYHDSSSLWSQSETRPPVPSSPAVLPGIARFTHVCTYDRPGTLVYDTNPPKIGTRSTPVKMPRTAGDVVTDLHELLAKAGVPGPYILVGHSLGGLFVRLYAQTHPDQVSGVVLVDAFAAEIPALFGAQWAAYNQLLDHPGTPYDNDQSFETIDISASVTQIEHAPPWRRMPLAVLTKTEPFPLPPGTPSGLGPQLERVWTAAAADMVGLEPQTPHTFVTGSDHYIQVRDPDVVVQTVRLVIGRAKHG
ncbi:MAG: alpha/beta hydrolase [Candidatus Dormibacteraeota bacterium]|nr:alpha/beta hydrolase [Candidatus Dormibacteraeota bacterium]MDQ6899665.1 alpha/beta hydrolase [Candidatus Dormibacteraeota bacterium]